MNKENYGVKIKMCPEKKIKIRNHRGNKGNKYYQSNKG